MGNIEKLLTPGISLAVITFTTPGIFCVEWEIEIWNSAIVLSKKKIYFPIKLHMPPWQPEFESDHGWSAQNIMRPFSLPSEAVCV